MKQTVLQIHNCEYKTMMECDTPYDIHNCPDYPPPNYPYTWNIRDVLKNGPRMIHCPAHTYIRDSVFLIVSGGTIHPLRWPTRTCHSRDGLNQDIDNNYEGRGHHIGQNTVLTIISFNGWNQRGWIRKLIGGGAMGDCDKDSSEYLFDELAFFQPRDYYAN